MAYRNAEFQTVEAAIEVLQEALDRSGPKSMVVLCEGDGATFTLDRVELGRFNDPGIPPAVRVMMTRIIDEWDRFQPISIVTPN